MYNTYDNSITVGWKQLRNNKKFQHAKNDHARTFSIKGNFF